MRNAQPIVIVSKASNVALMPVVTSVCKVSQRLLGVFILRGSIIPNSLVDIPLNVTKMDHLGNISAKDLQDSAGA